MINGLAEENKLFQGARKPAASHQSSVISNQFWGKKILFNRDWPRLAATQQESTRFDVLAGALTGRQKEPKTSPFFTAAKVLFRKKSVRKCPKVTEDCPSGTLKISKSKLRRENMSLYNMGSTSGKSVLAVSN